MAGDKTQGEILLDDTLPCSREKPILVIKLPMPRGREHENYSKQTNAKEEKDY